MYWNERILKNSKAFTIVELLVVIIIIGILATIALVSYSGISLQAITVAIKSDLDADSKLLKLYEVDYGSYPTSLDSNDCPDLPTASSQYCLKTSPGNIIDYTGAKDSFELIITHDSNDNGTADEGEPSYSINDSGTIAAHSNSSGTLSNAFAVAWGGGYEYYNFGYSMSKTSDNGYVVTGESRNYTSSIADMLLVKYDSDGSQVWSKTWGTSGRDIGYSVIQTSDNGYVVTGYSYGYGGAEGSSFLAKFDSSGNISWSKTWGRAGYDEGESVIQTSDGGYAVTGYSDSSLNGHTDMFIVKYDQNGTVTWNKTWGSTGDEWGNSIVQTSDGYIVTGQTDSFGAGSYDMFLAKYDTSGNLLWNKTWGGTASDQGNSIILTNDNGYMVTGKTSSFGAGGGDQFLAKYDSSGTLLWDKTWGGASSDTGNTVIQTSDNGYLVAGSTASYGAGSSDAVLIKYDSAGNLSWNKTWGGTDNDYGRSVVQVINNGFAITGTTASYGVGINEMILIKFNNSADISGCSATMCQTPVVSLVDPSATLGAPAATSVTPSVTVTSPNVTLGSPTPTNTPIIANSLSTDSFANAWGGAGGEWGGYSVVQANDGGYVVVGESDSFEENGDASIVKYDSSGNILWNKTWGGTGYDYANFVAKTNDGGYVITGETDSFEDSSGDVFIAKFNSSGLLQWNKTWGGIGYDYGSSVIQTSDGGYVITGETDSFDDSDGDMIILKYDSTGSLQWNKTWGGANWESGNSIIQAIDNNYIIAGNTSSYSAGSSDVFIVKYDTSGNLLWNKTWGGSSSESGNSIVQSNDGGYVVAGYTYTYGAGIGDMLLQKYDSSGSILWSKTWGGVNGDTGYSLAKTSDGGYAVVGGTSSFGTAGDAFLAKYDSSGNLLWSRTWGGADGDYALSLVQSSDGGYAITGNTRSYGAGSGDIFLIKYQSKAIIGGCISPMCQSPSASSSNPSATISNPTVVLLSPSATISNPSATVGSPSATLTSIITPSY